MYLSQSIILETQSRIIQECYHSVVVFFSSPIILQRIIEMQVAIFSFFFFLVLRSRNQPNQHFYFTTTHSPVQRQSVCDSNHKIIASILSLPLNICLGMYRARLNRQRMCPVFHSFLLSHS